MTNKTREKLREKWNQFVFEFSKRDILDSSAFVRDSFLWIEKSNKQSNNRILRKWKKAMDKAKPNFWPDIYLFLNVMNDEYLKAKKEIEG